MAKQDDGFDLANSIFFDITRKILSLELEPGALLSEKDLCDQYSASRTPVKTALNRLSAQGFINMKSYRQTTVRKINADEVLQLMYARVAIESRIIEDFLKKDTPLLFEDVAHVIRRQEIVISQPSVDPLEFHELDLAFHSTWYKAENKTRLLTLFSKNTDYVRLKILDYKRVQEYDVILREHKAIQECISSKDSSQLKKIMHLHIYDHIAGLIDSMKKEKDYFL